MITTRKIFIPLLLIALLCQCGGKKDLPELLVLRGRTMGTTFMVKVVKPDELAEKPASELNLELSTGIGEILKTVNQQMSTWLEDSEISRFNRYGETDWFSVSADTAAVISESLRVSNLTGGAFDITVGPLVDVWGFGAAKTEREIPPDEKIKAAMQKIGYQNVSVRAAPPAIKKTNPGIRCDLSALAKGFGVDKVAEYLESQGYMNYLVEIGGEIRAKGMNHNGTPWRVAIAAPGPGGKSPYQKIVSLSNSAMATSGDYHNYFEKDGIRYSHTIDPTTGRPITHKLVSVTVLHPSSCMTADALATAIDVLGPVKGYELAINENLPVFLVVKEAEGFVETMSPRFKELLGN